MKLAKRFPATPLALLILACNPANAKDFAVYVAASTQVSDNSKKTPLEPIEERQDVYQLGVNADYSNWLIDADVNYQLYAQQYSKQSQTDDEYANGSANLVFGQETDPLGLKLAHSRRMLLSSPDAPGLLENQQEREMISAQPILRKRISAADRLFLRGQATSVRFLGEENDQDSTRTGATAGWTRAISKTSGMMLSSQYLEVGFDQQPSADYQLINSSLAYNVQLRKLKYSVQLGYNEIAPELGTKERAPSYNLNVGYESGYHFFGASIDQQITDSSFGNGNLGGDNQIPVSDGLSQDLGRVDRRDTALNFNTSGICARCVFSLGVSLVEDDYLDREEELRTTYLRSGFSYAFSTAASLMLRWEQSEYDQESAQLNSQYTTEYLSLEYVYRFARGLDVRLFTRNEQRSSEGSMNKYDENITGAGVKYLF